MPVFEVTSRSAQLAYPVEKLPSILRWWRQIILRLTVGGIIIALLAILLGNLGLSVLFFLLLPVVVTVISSYFQVKSRKELIFRACLALLYFSALTGWELLTHSSKTAEIVVVTTTLALAVLFEPLRAYVQSFMEQRFHLRDNEAVKIIEAFTSTLREEIDLDRVREGVLSELRKAMQPQSVSLWIRQPVQSDQGPSVEQVRREKDDLPVSAGGTSYVTTSLHIKVDDDDAFMAYALHHLGVMDIDRVKLDSPVMRQLKTSAVEIGLPLVSQGKLIGLLTLGPRLNGQDYTREERGMLNTLAAQLAPALNVAQMVQEQQAEVVERERIEQELRTAQDIQHTFLPKDVPQLSGWQLVPYYQPAREVGGDFYDFFTFEDGRLGLVIGDVTDKGIPAALVMTAARTMLRTAALERASPGEVFAQVNDLLYAEISPMMFVTCFYAILDPCSGRICYANAGHDLPYRRQQDGVSELRATGMPLGLMPGTHYDEYEAIVAPGESILFYTDGLVEAHNPKREMFSFPRLKTLLTEHTGGAPLIDLLLGELRSFTGEGWEQEDDVTLLSLQRTPV